MKTTYNNLLRLVLIAFGAFLLTAGTYGQGEVTRSGSTWNATVNGNNVYSGNRMFDAVNAAINNMGSGTINIRNSGDSGNDDGSIYAIRPQSNQTLDFHGHTINCNASGDLIVAIYGDGDNNVTVQNLHITGNPRYAIWFRGCDGMTFSNITMDLSNDSPVGLGIRVDASTGSSSDLTINGNININGSAGHAIETYSVNGVNIGDVTVTNTGGCGVLLNDSENCQVGVVTGDYNDNGGGYATFRVANNNRSTYCEGVYSRNSGRGFFSVSDSRDCTVGWVDIANTSSHGIFLEDATNTHVECGTVSGGNPNCQEVRTSNCSINVNGCGGSDCSGDGGSGGGDDGSGSGNYYQLRNRGTGLYLDGMGRTTNGDACGQWSNTSHQNSHWELIGQGGDYYQLRNRGTGLYLDGMGRTTNGDDVGQWANTSHQNSHWELQQYDGSYYRLQNRNTGLFLDGMGRTSDGDNVGQWANTTHVNAQWELISQSSSQVNKNTEETNTLSIYPNPLNGSNLTISTTLTDASDVEIQIYNAVGQVVYSETFKEYTAGELNHEIDLSQLTSGSYIVNVTIDQETFNNKLLVQ